MSLMEQINIALLGIIVGQLSCLVIQLFPRKEK